MVESRKYVYYLLLHFIWLNFIFIYSAFLCKLIFFSSAVRYTGLYWLHLAGHVYEIKCSQFTFDFVMCKLIFFACVMLYNIPDRKRTFHLHLVGYVYKLNCS